MRRHRELAVPIPLKVWQDPQGDVVLHFSRQHCLIYFACWTDSGDPADYLGKLTFESACAARCIISEYPPYDVKEPFLRSSILVIQNSSWIEEITALQRESYPNAKPSSGRKFVHYVVVGHDHYYDIMAVGFTESTVPRSEAGELVRLINEA